MTTMKKLLEMMLEFKSSFYYGWCDENQGAIYDKISDRFVQGLEKLYAKNIASEYKLACGIKKAIESNLTKMLSHKDMRDMLIATLDDFGITCRTISGKLTDEDYEKYVNNIIVSSVDKKELDGVVIGGAYAFEFEYFDEDDEEICKMIIPASIVVVGSYQVD